MFAPLSRENSVAYAAAAVVFIGMIAILAFFWNQAKKHDAVAPTVAFAKFGPYQVQTQNYEVLASFAVVTGTENAGWAMENKANLDVIFKTAMTKSDPQSTNGRNAMEVLQDALKDEANQDLHTKNVKAVFLTSYIRRPRK